MNAEEFFIKECAAHACGMPVASAVNFLRGMLQVCPDVAAMHPIRDAYDSLTVSEGKLDVIASGQLKFDFPVSEGGDK